MALKDKYSKLIQYAQNSGIQNLSIVEQDKVLYVSGTADEATKDKIWQLYNEIDPDMRSGDMVLKINVIPGSRPEETYEVKSGDNLSKIARNYPGITWQSIYEANKDIISDPNNIYPGQKLRIPTSR